MGLDWSFTQEVWGKKKIQKVYEGLGQTRDEGSWDFKDD